MSYIEKLKYESLIGEGYFSIVKKYQNPATHEPIAIKQLKKDHYENNDYRFRFGQEIYIQRKLGRHPNIVHIIEDGSDSAEKLIWYAMPLAFQNLHTYIKANNSSLTQENRFHILDQIFSAIHFAHSSGVIHRDLSPHNILVFEESSRAYFRVSDFGLGKSAEILEQLTRSSANGYGHAIYVSPEQKEKLKNSTYQSDIYSLGALTFFVITGREPLRIDPTALHSLINRAMKDNPTDRFADMPEFLAHYQGLKNLAMPSIVQVMSKLTMAEYLAGQATKEWLTFHKLACSAYAPSHVYSDYIQPVMSFLNNGDNLLNYLNSAQDTIREFVSVFIKCLHDCYGQTGWPFTDLDNFGYFLNHIYGFTSDLEAKLYCFQEIWNLAYTLDQWDVQRVVRQCFNSDAIPAELFVPIAEFVQAHEAKIYREHFSGVSLPEPIKQALENIYKN
jgi:serine/threonine protein kinase